MFTAPSSETIRAWVNGTGSFDLLVEAHEKEKARVASEKDTGESVSET